MFKGVLPFMYTYWQSYYSPIITLMYSLIHLYVITELVKTRIFKRLYAFLMGTTRCLDEISYYKYCFNLPDVNITVGRLLQNATHMGLSLEPFYGEDAVKNIVH